MCGFIAQLVEHRTGIAEVTGSNPVEALIFFRLLYSNCLNWKFTAKITYHLDLNFVGFACMRLSKHGCEVSLHFVWGSAALMYGTFCQNYCVLSQ